MKVKDPVCGMTIEEKDAAATSIYQAKTYYFCSASCKEKFEKDPASYVGEIKPEKKKHALGSCPTCGRELFPDELHTHTTKTEWTCPMHPEVHKPGPGACPKCGMPPE